MKRLCVIFIILLAGSSQGQVRPVVSSIEARAAGAEFICVGQISKIDRMDGLIIEVTETLKGPRRKTITAQRNGNFGYDTVEYYEAAMKAGTEFVWFGSKDSARTEYSLDPASSPYRSLGGLAPGMDFTILRTRKEVLDRIRKFLKENPNPARAESLLTPMPGGSLTGFVDFIVPVCPWAEVAAMRMITKPNAFQFQPARGNPYKPASAANLEKSKAGMLRVEGLILLRHFKSDTNIRLVKQYLNDDIIAVRSETPGGSFYLARDAAHRLLIHWGVAVTKPVIEAPAVDEMEGYLRADNRRIAYMLQPPGANLGQVSR